MDVRKIDAGLSVAGQIHPDDMEQIAARGFRAIIGNRPDGEESSQPEWRAIAAAAEAHGLLARHIPVGDAHPVETQIPAFLEALDELPKPVLAFCRTGNRSAQLHKRASVAASRTPLVNSPKPPRRHHRVVIAGGGSGGLGAAASLLKRRRDLDIAVIEPSEEHYYQPGWTMVGGGVFRPEQTARREADVMPDGVTWIRAAVAGFDPDARVVELDDGSRVSYDLLIVAMGNRLAWEEVEGLEDALGRNGVTSNYRYDLAPYTWQLVQQLRSGRAIFTQPAMPIKCAGAPQKAMYLSCSEWEKQGALGNIDVQFHNQGDAIFGVKEYVPALMDTVRRYGIGLHFGSNLVRVDGDAKKAWFATDEGEVERDFDMIHVCPPQKGNAVVAGSPLANDAGYAEVDQQTLRHTRYSDVFALGDCGSTPNAKTMAAARKQAPVIAVNALNVLDGKEPNVAYDGYGSCPLTVENGKIVLAEFLYGGKVAPSFPAWLNDSTKPTRLAWHLKADVLPFIYWHGMLKGREWLAMPGGLSAA